MPDWLKEYVPPLSNEEMMKYGYDENGEAIDAFEKFTSYLSYLQDIDLMFRTYDPRKAPHPKTSISY